MADEVATEAVVVEVVAGVVALSVAAVVAEWAAHRASLDLPRAPAELAVGDHPPVEVQAGDDHQSVAGAAALAHKSIVLRGHPPTRDRASSIISALAAALQRARARFRRLGPRRGIAPQDAPGKAIDHRSAAVRRVPALVNVQISATVPRRAPVSAIAHPRDPASAIGQQHGPELEIGPAAEIDQVKETGPAVQVKAIAQGVQAKENVPADPVKGTVLDVRVKAIGPGAPEKVTDRVALAREIVRADRVMETDQVDQAMETDQADLAMEIARVDQADRARRPERAIDRGALVTGRTALAGATGPAAQIAGIVIAIAIAGETGETATIASVIGTYGTITIDGTTIGTMATGMAIGMAGRIVFGTAIRLP